MQNILRSGDEIMVGLFGYRILKFTWIKEKEKRKRNKVGVNFCVYEVDVYLKRRLLDMRSMSNGQCTCMY